MTVMPGETLPRGLIVSCQPVTGGPMDDTETIVRLALAARDGGAVGLRIEGAANVAAVAAACALPIVGLVKRDLADSPVRITPYLDDVRALAEAGATIVAVDATDRERPVPVEALVRDIQAQGCLAMADLAAAEEARAAAAMGFDILGTTLSGYTGGPVPDRPDLGLVETCAALGRPVVAEGRYNTPALAAEAMARGARAVCVGSAITRTEHVTGWFRDAVAAAMGPAEPVLAFDIGGTKTLAALVQGSAILGRRMVPTDRAIGTPAWFDGLSALAGDWKDRYGRVAAAVTGLVADGLWSALNPATLPIPGVVPLAAILGQRFGRPALAWNDAQAAAWGEYRFGAGAGRDMVFLTISSGIGGGIVTGGRLRTGARGLAGSLGQILRCAGGERLEHVASGFGMARAAQEAGHPGDAREVFAAHARGEDWACRTVADAARELALALVNLQALVDPQVVLLGGGVGRLPAFQEEVLAALSSVDARLRPQVEPAKLGAESGLLGAADLASTERAGT